MSPLRTFPKPTGLRKAWEHDHMDNESTGKLLRRYHANPHWGDPVDAEAWFNEDGQLRVCRALYANNRLMTLKLKRKNWEAAFTTARETTDA